MWAAEITAVDHLEPGSEFAGLRIERELGRGAFGTVYLAQDTLIGRTVALKLLRTPGGEIGAPERKRVLNEARVIGNLNSPHIVTLHRVHPLDDGDGWIFEMEYVDGGSLHDLLERETRLKPERALTIARGVLSALQAAHQAGVVHGDIKPGNVLLSQAGGIKLADFGLAQIVGDASLNLSIEARMVGTPRFMAPEVVMGEPPRIASDLWSLGIVLYRMLCGRLPFTGRDFHALFLAIQNTEAPPVDADVSSELKALVGRLLLKEPLRRPESAAAVLEQMDVATGVAAPAVREKAAAEPEPVQLLFGRDEEAGQLRALLERAVGGKGATVLIHGEAGMGKTALLRQLQATAGRERVHWLEAVVTRMEGLTRPVLRAAARHLSPGHLERDIDVRVTGERFGSAAPLLRRMLSGGLDLPVEGRDQIAWALEQLFQGLARRGPLVVVLEDAHCADVEDLRLLGELARNLVDEPILLAIAHRTDSATSGQDAQREVEFRRFMAMPEVQHIELQPLAPEAIYQQLKQRAHGVRLEGALAQRVVRIAEGNPLLAEELLRHLMDAGALVQEGSLLRATPAMDETRLPRRFHDLAAARLGDLPEEQRALLDVAAVDGVEFDGEAISAALERPLLDVLRELQRLCRERNLVTPHEHGYRFTSAMLQEVIYEEIAPALRRVLHHNLARHLEARGPDAGIAPERLGLHWEGAGNEDKARPYLIRAGLAASLRQEAHRAIDLYKRAGLAPGALTPAIAGEHADALLELATSSYRVGRHDDAERVYAALLAAAAEADDDRLRFRSLVARALKRYDTRGVEAVDEDVLEQASRALPSCRERAEACYLLGLIAKFRGELQTASRWLETADEIYQSLGIEALHSAALDQLASVTLRAGRLEEAEQLYAEAARISAHVGRRTNAAISEINRVRTAVERGRLDGVEPILSRAVKTLAVEGDNNQAPHGCAHLSELRYALGDLAGAEQAVREGVEMLGTTDFLPAIIAVRVQEASLAVARGSMDSARTALAAARDAAQKANDTSHLAIAAGIETQIRCLMGDVDGAKDSAGKAAGLGARMQEARARLKVAVLLTEAAFYGLGEASLVGAERQLLSGSIFDDAREAVVRALMRSGRAFAAADGNAAALDEGAQMLDDAVGANRRAVLRTTASWMRAEARFRSQQPDEARRIAGLALGAARSLGHVWLQAGVLRTLRRFTGERIYDEQRNALLRPVAEGLKSHEDRVRLMTAWTAR
ncbi:MAG: protein kinase [Planctomycetota bacterium]|nr:protein kinase [Planctomycetota bacterium]